jgi:maltose O-acetyltransferase
MLQNDDEEPIANNLRQMAFMARFVRALRREVELLDPRYALAEAVSAAIPQLAFSRTRTAILRAGGLRIGPRSLVMGELRVTGDGDRKSLLSIGSDSMITGPLRIDLGAAVHIGNHVYIGHDVAMLTVDHEIGPSSQRCGQHDRLPIVIHDGVWIASRVTILPGVTIGRGAVVAAGAVLTRDVPPDTLVAGVPAEAVRDLDQEGVAPVSRRRRESGDSAGKKGGWVDPTATERGRIAWLAADRRRAKGGT